MSKAVNSHSDYLHILIKNIRKNNSFLLWNIELHRLIFLKVQIEHLHLMAHLLSFLVLEEHPVPHHPSPFPQPATLSLKYFSIMNC